MGRVRVLVVEDDRSLGAVVQRGLTEEGHAVDLERTLAGARRAVAINSYRVIVLDPATHTVRRAGVLVPLTAREFALLHYLLDRAGTVVRRADLLEAVWDANYDGLSNVVDVHVANLRRKLDLPGNPAPIDTVR